MARPKKDKTIRTPRVLPDLPGLNSAIAPSWKFVLFTDLHVGTKTIDRALDLLGAVRETAKKFDSQVVCLGDFWDQRAALSVRQLDLIQKEFELWGHEGVSLKIIPGNHDQVSLDGRVNAVRIFDAFPHISVLTEPLIDQEKRLAFLPWRETPGEQARLFSSLDGNGWTIFAHADVKGALANSGTPSPGHVSLETINDKARACYLGHYHKRQLLGDRVWYIGSPFEMNFGERDEPHGIAYVDSLQVEPAFLDLEHFPKHHRFSWPEDKEALEKARPQDIVEIQFTPSALQSGTLHEVAKQVRAADLRPVVKRETSKVGSTEQPAKAVTSLRDGVKAFVDQFTSLQEASGRKVSITEQDELLYAGKAYLAEVPDARTIAPLAKRVRFRYMSISNFCALQGNQVIDLNLGTALVRGPMGSGKTSICDALTWVLYGATTPRKPGDRVGSLRADDVIHDSEDFVAVSVQLYLDLDSRDDVLVEITRSKKRGQGAKLRISGVERFEQLNGISDTQEAVHRLIGLDLDLWRATVYLGQGAVANFVTDADKRRKELLSRVFGLSACEVARKKVKEDIGRRDTDLSTALRKKQEAEAQLETLKASDFSQQIEQWDALKQASLDDLTKVGKTLSAKIEELAPHLQHESAWVTQKQGFDERITALTKALSDSSNTAAIQKLSSELGAAQAELGMLQKAQQDAQQELQQWQLAKDAGQVVLCPSCGQVLADDGAENHVEIQQRKITTRQLELQQVSSRAANLQVQLNALRAGPAPNTEHVMEQLKEAREGLEKCSTALATLLRMKEAREQLTARLSETRKQWLAKNSEENPFVAKNKELSELRTQYEEALKTAESQIAVQQKELFVLKAWDEGFGPKGIPALVLRSVMSELEYYANAKLAALLSGRIYVRLAIEGEDMVIRFFEYVASRAEHVERTFYQLSGGQRRCVELALSPFALSELIFDRCGVRVELLMVDELTTHLDPETKPLLCAMLRNMERETVWVIDHDLGVQSEFDFVFDIFRTTDGTVGLRRAA